MKRSRLQRLASLALSMFVALSMMVAGTGGVYAASNWVVGAGNDGIIWQGEQVGVWVYNTKTENDAKITSVKSSNSRVKVIRNSYGGGDVWFNLQGKKIGRATLTIKFKAGGKTRTIKKTVTVKKYPKQIKSLKVNGKKIRLSGEKKFHYVKHNYKKTSATIQMKLKKGWKITFVNGQYHAFNSGRDGSISKIQSKISSGKTIKFPKKWDLMTVTVRMEKGNNAIYYNFEFWR